tara:strand:- start:17035 stop:17640 length:606 start_codon:yes stop_codon:yes gene_type:complete
MSRNAYIETLSSTSLVTQAEAKTHLRVSQDDDNTYIDNLILVAQQTIENYCNLLLFRTTVIQRGNCWVDVSSLYFSPVKNSGAAAVTHIKYYDVDNVLTSWAATNYIVDIYSQPVRIGLAPGIALPGLANRIDAIEVKYSIGTNTVADIPMALKQACLILVGQWYENRQEAVVGRSVGTIPMTARYLMEPYKIQTLGIDVC